MENNLDLHNRRLLNNNAYFAYFLIGAEKMITDKVPTAAVGIRGFNQVVLYINPDFWSKLSDPEKSWVFHHEVLHLVYGHLFTHTNFAIKSVFNIAADIYINQQIGKQNAPKGALFPETYNLPEGLSTAQYYSEILKQQNKNLEKLQEKLESGEPFEFGEEGYMTQHMFNPEDLDDSPTDSDEERKYKDIQKTLLNQQFKQIFSDIKDNFRGKYPAGLETELGEEIKAGTIPWKALFKRFISTHEDVKTKPTRKWQSRYHEEYTRKQFLRKIKVWVVLDTSGSVSNEDLGNFFSEINSMYNSGALVKIVETDAKVQNVYDYEGKIPNAVKGRGGTEMSPGIEYVNANSKKEDLLIVLTDGYIESNPTPSKNPSLWVITPNGSTDFNSKGKKIKLN